MGYEDKKLLFSMAGSVALVSFAVSYFDPLAGPFLRGALIGTFIPDVIIYGLIMAIPFRVMWDKLSD
jgi:cytochrome c oxidase subunit IV